MGLYGLATQGARLGACDGGGVSPLLSTLREPAIRDQVVWRDHPRACLCHNGHPHLGDVTASRLADLVEAGDERAEDRLRAIVLMGVAAAVRNPK